MSPGRPLLKLYLSDRQIETSLDLLKEVLLSPLIIPVGRGQDHDLICCKAAKGVLAKLL